MLGGRRTQKYCPASVWRLEVLPQPVEGRKDDVVTGYCALLMRDLIFASAQHVGPCRCGIF